ncbi:alkaline phosphatase D [Litorimonas taeanensis]|uniref:Alkaline phosphatase D n=1 Tax=Litorimonas taeanensis TaxID=568099 RepID=A0A420WDH7_9PROT|nr:alkaline phosphatase D family protein [Litorimonas taeanensis]RKQ69079.1 alkaline phosphatase D [Litorimonas taeanensis]
MKNPLQKLPTRRGFLGALGVGSVAACADTASLSFSAKNESRSGQFAHGVSSGDPFSDSVILWTRVTPDTEGPVELVWEIDQDANFKSLSASGNVTTNASKDYTVKVEATGLQAGTWYFYRFRIGETVSQIGRTRTLPNGSLQAARFAVVSCSNWQHGYFNAYDHIARQAEGDAFDALIHLGDYYYEYGIEDAPKLPDRAHLPPHEIITLKDYRTRHAQYRSDSTLQDVTAKMPLIAVWDDHETTNDSWKGGAENHNSDEGDWDIRREAALRAYYEWMPLREPKFGRSRNEIYRAFEWGDLASIVCVETRLTARAEQIIVEDYIDQIDTPGGAEKFKKDILNAPNRDMLGKEQQEFIVDTFKASKAKGTSWRLLANQVIMGRLLTPDFTPYIDESALETIEQDWAGVRDFLTLSKYNVPVYPDSWDGYPVARNAFYNALSDADIHDMLVLTGDAHEFWVNELTTENHEKMGVELVTSSVSSQTLTAYLGEATADHNLLLTQSNQDARYYNALVNGYIDLSLTQKKAKVKMVGISTVLSRDYEAFDAARFTLRKSKDTIKVTAPKGLNFKQRLLFAGLG